MSIDSVAPELFRAPRVKVDGFPVAITADMAVNNDLSDMGTGIGFSKIWSQETIDLAAERSAAQLAGGPLQVTSPTGIDVQDGLVLPAAGRVTRD